jgi:hypothetical protein
LPDLPEGFVTFLQIFSQIVRSEVNVEKLANVPSPRVFHLTFIIGGCEHLAIGGRFTFRAEPEIHLPTLAEH